MHKPTPDSSAISEMLNASSDIPSSEPSSTPAQTSMSSVRPSRRPAKNDWDAKAIARALSLPPGRRQRRALSRALAKSIVRGATMGAPEPTVEFEQPADLTPEQRAAADAALAEMLGIHDETGQDAPEMTLPGEVPDATAD